jgi:hypothetical protein
MQAAPSCERFVSLDEGVTLQRTVIFGYFPTVKDLPLRYEDKLVEVV